MPEVHDYIVVGSGCTGAMVAQTLVESGVRVTMLDVGVQDKTYKGVIPKKDFISIRKEENEQHEYLLGKNFESIPLGNVGTGAQLTPPRKFMTELVEKYLPLVSENFFPMESLAYGGLGNGWGLGCCEFSRLELEKCGLDVLEMKSAYKIISERIGISGSKDDASAYTIGELDNVMPPLEMNTNNKLIFEKYQQKKEKLNSRGFFMGRPALAVLTEDKGERKKYNYDEMDFYSDNGKSAYRPWITVDELRKKNNFNYTNNVLVTDFSEENNMTKVSALNVETNEHVSYFCKKLILTPGVLVTARIVLRSFRKQESNLPLISNVYTYMPCINWKMLGKEMDEKNVGFAQLTLLHDANKENFDVAMASLYSYRSLMLFRLLKETPLNFRDGRIIMNYLLPALTILGIHHPEQGGESKFLKIKTDQDSPTGDKLIVEYKLTKEEKEKNNSIEKKFIRAMRSLGCKTLKKVNPGNGSSIHYAGTLPFNDEQKQFSVSHSGKLNGTKNVFVADGSGFKYLPAKGLTFSLMANAHIVAKNVLKNE